MAKRLVTAALLLAPIAAFTACDSDPAPNQPTETSPTAAPDAEQISTELRTPDGTAVANATIDFSDGYATVRVETIEDGILSPGFHGLHIHEVGQCEPNSLPPGGGERGDFLSAGGHFQAPGHSGHPASGDLTSLQVRSDGGAMLVTTTDAFTAEDLRGGQGTVLMIHADEDNFANIPERYTTDGEAGPDQQTLNTGDAGDRVACGVLTQGTDATTTTTEETVTETETSPTTVTTTSPPPAPAPTETGTTTTVTETTSPTTTTETSPPTETTPTPTTTTTPPPGG